MNSHSVHHNGVTNEDGDDEDYDSTAEQAMMRKLRTMSNERKSTNTQMETECEKETNNTARSMVKTRSEHKDEDEDTSIHMSPLAPRPN